MNYEGVLQDGIGNNFYPKTRYAHIKMRGLLWRGTSFNDVALSAESSAYTVNAETFQNNELPGYPSGAYKYGTLITINPSQSLVEKWDIVQIYVPDRPTVNGIYFRTHTNRDWLKISGEAVAPTS